MSAARRHRAVHHAPVDIEAMLHAAAARHPGRTVGAGRSAQLIQRHADAIGQGIPSAPPTKGHFRRG